MTAAFAPDSEPERPAFAASRAPALFDRLSMSKRWAWLGQPATYAIGALVLTLLGSGATLMAPRLLDPTAFGTFALLTSLFTYAGRADLGLSQLADKQIPGRQTTVAARAALEILNTLWVVGMVVLAATLPLVFLLTGGGATLPLLGTVLAIGGGIMAMIANGPVTLYRASSRVWEFTVLALILQLGMTVPRLAGLMFGGVTGSFAALAAYYTLCALLFARPLPMLTQRPSFMSMARLALPLFAFNASWVFYLSANRWVSSTLSSPHDLGLFSFGASLAMIGLGLMSTIAQVRYPKLLARMIDRSPQRDAVIIERELLRVALGLAVIALVSIVAAGRVIAFAFPAYEEATPATIALAVSCIPLGTMVWIVPMIIVRSTRPGRDALMLTVVGLVTLVVGMAAGNYLAGIEGQAWGNVAAALLMLAAMAILMYRLGMVTLMACGRIIGVQALILAILAFLSFLHPAQAAGSDTEAAAPAAVWKTVFTDDFSTLDLRSNGKGMWQPYYPTGERTNAGNKELEYYVDPRPNQDSTAIQALKPYSVENGVLTIRASEIPQDLRSQSKGLRYASGLLNTAGRFSFTYGSVEIRAKVPAGRGLWPAFWLLPEDRTWPPEIDVFEILGHEPGTLHVTAHSGLHIPAGAGSAQTGRAIRVGDLSRDFHVYGMTWTKDKIVWSLDGKQVFKAATPKDLNKPMFLVLNLAVGGSWPGSPDSTTKLPASLLVDWIRVRQPDDGKSDQDKGIIQ
ncbi:family 16 glycosylhydrolase [Rhizobium sp. BK376]|uniref:family 16 glycosylhydrolase n=1 Tax=Rhizobium sp. BK376 TaxID=2512149 RepID=UPI0010486B1E|nr:family 16 glycosylhydrolase [Rhizobium sp. BK376]TCR73226.1 beta-glucanase (GH16 family) [Rhizobium sp. BK376]